ncbi:MAG: bifunctional diaminohydroxyphosphoribosylaminopyrimidine deaminase/5-amino-6-(5-phosphoribosylamino)uracil reductase RibD [Pseudohongiella sp.]|nr:bifunctional diaminohydroxyphosphoribosylaminopyrimidine deaminase/5-amino-6-(5-phosphoribosylamino)uracil reductase RibD [Pseudohongiella sp.]MDO9521350.1 bifunctional diaminohydroxyphosphoribosylaminopyrimidine deaminase/5-amino-6-(5-phosphoribosylamino)uracil reductase RibD [Pseudohongiella sp.]MDP2125882.1 bifunctional diaminohydroxyphosphoribosylaminopyrimidine deaminase/5-amino-6-(5-phosphoribosylamino)uracil reductase RibD [Pseudohongiella sp.]
MIADQPIPAQVAQQQATPRRATPEQAMQRALALAGSVLTAGPNPRVGCVIVRDGVVVGEGFHARAGDPHAEANALSQAGELARGASVYVSLEPCSHTGRTPPCSEALVHAGVAEVIFAGADPNPKVCGRGLTRMREAGIKVTGPTLPEQADALNPGFIKRMKYGLPFVRCKMAMSLDGRTAMASGESKWITGPVARADVQRLRATSCAIITGINTVLSDNPSLNVRPEQLNDARAQHLAGRQPLRVILDSTLRTPTDAAILRQPGKVLLLTGAAAENSQTYSGEHVRVQALASGSDGRPDLRAALQSLALDYECNDVLLEAGPTLSGAMVQAGLVDELIIYIGAKLLGSDALPLFKLAGLNRMQDQIELRITGMEQMGDDIRLTARPIVTPFNKAKV